VLKALITEPRLQLEAKFRDPIMMDNHSHIIVASNNDWFVPAGMGDRRWFILDVANTHAGTRHADYWNALYAEIENGGAAAFFYDLLNMDLTKFNVRDVPHTAAKAQQQTHSLRGTDAWLYNVLQEGAIGGQSWQINGLTVTKDQAYDDYVEFSKQQHAWRPDGKSVWSRKISKLLGPCIQSARERDGGERVRVFKFAPLADCRGKFETHVPNIEWEEPNNEPDLVASANPVTPDEVNPAEVSPQDGADADAPLQRPDELGKSAWRGTL
jgi:Mesyanzhinovviridae bifunctional DNA primase/polymerase